MNMMTRFGDMARAPGDPKVLSKGTSSLGASDRLARALGWFSIGLGLTELLAPRLLARTLGMEGRETLLRACGVREITSGVMSLSINPRPGIVSRIAGDGMDMAMLAVARRPDNPKRNAVDLAIAAVIGLTILDIVCHQGLRSRHRRPRGPWRDYSDRSGYPRGIDAARGVASRVTGTPRQQPGEAVYDPEHFPGG